MEPTIKASEMLLKAYTRLINDRAGHYINSPKFFPEPVKLLIGGILSKYNYCYCINGNSSTINDILKYDGKNEESYSYLTEPTFKQDKNIDFNVLKSLFEESLPNVVENMSSQFSIEFEKGNRDGVVLINLIIE